MPASDRQTDRQSIVTLDLEGVLVPEIWIAVAERTGVPELRRTTRDEPDYEALMAQRLALLERHELTMPVVTDVISSLVPLDGARDFLDELRAQMQVVLLSDTFEQFATPLMRQLGWPTLLCHRLAIDGDRIVGYTLRIKDHKRRAVRALQSLNFRVVAAGDSYNDTAMLADADAGFLFRAPPNVREQFSQFRALDDYGELLEAILSG